MKYYPLPPIPVHPASAAKVRALLGFNPPGIVESPELPTGTALPPKEVEESTDD